jgi:hypothetical protein
VSQPTCPNRTTNTVVRAIPPSTVVAGRGWVRGELAGSTGVAGGKVLANFFASVQLAVQICTITGAKQK